MPTIPEIKAELKALGVKGITGKNKAELMAMLEQAKAPKEAPKKKGPKIYRKPEIGDVSEPPIIAPKRKPEIGDVSEPPIIAPKKKGPRIAPKKPEIGEDGLAELLGIIAESIAGRPVPVKAEPAKAESALTIEGEAIQSFGHFIWRQFDGGEIKGKNYRQTAGGMFPMYAFDLLDVKDAWWSYWAEWKPIIGLKIPGTSGKAIATCQTDGTVSFTNIMLEGKATKQGLDRVIVEEFREYGAGDLEPRYKKIAEALTTMKVINQGKSETDKPKKASPPRIPLSIKDTMKRKLTQEYDLHEYKMGLAHPIDDMIKWFKKIMNQDIWGRYTSVATGFLSDLIKWVRENSHEVQEFPFGTHDRKEQALLLSDWEDFFKANR